MRKRVSEQMKGLGMSSRQYVCGLLFLMMILPCFVYADNKPADVTGTWLITIKFVAGEGQHSAVITQKDSTLTGVYKGEFKEGTLRGRVKGNTIDFTGYLKHQAMGVRFSYKGSIEGNTMKGTVDMGEYWTATFTAKRGKKKH